jgi:hypothetical protein
MMIGLCAWARSEDKAGARANAAAATAKSSLRMKDLPNNLGNRVLFCFTVSVVAAIRTPNN